MTDETPLPGNDLQLTDIDLFNSLGRYFALFELEQRRRVILAQAYIQLHAQYTQLHEQLKAVSKQK